MADPVLDVINAAMAAGLARKEEEARRQAILSAPITLAPPPTSAGGEFLRHAGAAALGSALGVPFGLESLALQAGGVPGEVANEPNALFREGLHQLTGADKPAQHAFAAGAGELIGELVGMAVPGMAAHKVATAVGRTAAFGSLAQRTPLLARGVQHLIEATGLEASTGEPTWKGVAGFLALDAALRSYKVAAGAAGAPGRLGGAARAVTGAGETPLPVWDPTRMKWFSADELGSRDVFELVRQVAVDTGADTGTVANLMWAQHRESMFAGLFDPANHVSANAAKFVTLTFKDGQTITLRNVQNYLDATSHILEGGAIDKVIASPTQLARLKAEFVQQEPEEVRTLLEIARQRMRGEVPAGREAVGKPGGATSDTRARNLMVVREGTNEYALELSPASAKRVRPKLLEGKATIVDFRLKDARRLDPDYVEGLLREMYGKRYDWEAKGVYLGESGSGSNLIEFTYRHTPREGAPYNARVAFKLAEDGKLGADAAEWLTQHPDARPLSVRLAHTDDVPTRFNVAQDIKRLEDARAAVKQPGVESEATSAAATADTVQRELSPSEVPTPATVDSATRLDTSVELRGFTPMSEAEQADVAAHLATADIGTEQTKAFAEGWAKRIQKAYHLDEAMAQNTPKAAFLRNLATAMERGQVSPLTWTMGSIMVHNMPERIFNASKLGLEISEQALRGVFDPARMTIILAPGASVNTLAHELAEATLRLFKPEHADALARNLVDEIKASKPLEKWLASLPIAKSDPLEHAAQVLGELYLDRYVTGKLAPDALRALERGTMWQRLKETMRSMWLAVRSVMGLRGTGESATHKSLDRIWVKTEELIGQIEAGAPQTSAEDWIKRLTDAGFPTLDATAIDSVRGTLRTELRDLLNAGEQKLVKLRPNGAIELRVGADHPDFEAHLDRTVQTLVDQIGFGSKKWEWVRPDSVALEALHKEYRLSSFEGFDAIVRINDKPLRLGIAVQGNQLFVRRSYIHHLLGGADPAVIDFNVEKFVKGATNALSARVREDTVKQLGEKGVLEGIKKRIIHNLKLTTAEAADLKLTLEGDNTFFRVTFDGPKAETVLKRAQRYGWTEDDLIYGFTRDGELDVRRWTNIAVGRKTAVSDRSLVVTIDPSTSGADTVMLKYARNVPPAKRKISELLDTPLSDPGSGGVAELVAPDYDTAAAALSRIRGDNAPMLVVRDRTADLTGYQVHLRFPGAPAGSELVLNQASLFGEGVERAAFTQDLRLALQSGYQIQAVRGPFEGRVETAIEDIAHALKHNTPRIAPEDLHLRPDGLRLLLQVADDRGLALVPKAAGIDVLTLDGTKSWSFTDGKALLEFLHRQPRADIAIADPWLDGVARDVAERWKAEAGVVDASPNFSPDVPDMGFAQRLWEKGRNLASEGLQIFDYLAGPMQHFAYDLDRKMLDAAGKPKWDIAGRYERARLLLAKRNADTADDLRPIMDLINENKDKARVELQTLAMAHFVGAPDASLGAGEKALRAAFLRANPLTAEDHATIKRLSEWYERLYDVYQEAGLPTERHIYGYFNKLYTSDSPNLLGALRDPNVRGALRQPGQTLERVIPGVKAPRGRDLILDWRQLTAQYSLRARHYINLRPLSEEVEGAIRQLKSIPQPEFGRSELFAQRTLEHIGNQLRGTGPAMSTAVTAFGSMIRELTRSSSSAEQLVGSLTEAVYVSSLGFRISSAVRNRLSTPLLVYPLVGGKHMMRGMQMARELVNNPTGPLAKFRDAVYTQFLKEQEADITQAIRLAGGRADRPLDKVYEFGMVPMRVTETKVRAEAYFAGISAAHEMMEMARSGVPIKRILTETSAAFFHGAQQENILGHLEKALTSEAHALNFAKFYGDLIVSNTMWRYGELEAFAAGRGKVGKLLTMFGTWPANYLRYLQQGIMPFRSLGTGESSYLPFHRKFIARWVAVNAAGMAAFSALGVYTGNMFWLSPVEYSGSPFANVLSDAYDIVKLRGDEERLARARFTRNMMAMFTPAGGRDLYRTVQQLGEGNVGNALLLTVGYPDEMRTQQLGRPKD